jgi:hypothetical protein
LVVFGFLVFACPGWYPGRGGIFFEVFEEEGNEAFAFFGFGDFGNWGEGAVGGVDDDLFDHRAGFGFGGFASIGVAGGFSFG